MKNWPSILLRAASLVPAAVAIGVVAASASEPAYPRVERPKIYLSLNSLYGTASDHRHIRDFGGAYEMPVGETWTLVARFRHLDVKQAVFDEQERADNIYANAFPSDYQVLGFQAAMRRHPWEWMPGFFAEAVMGYKRITGEPESAGRPRMYGREIWGFTNHAFETAIGFGYLWEVKRLRIALGYAFGPELLIRKSVYSDGKTEVSSDVGDLLRFNQLEAGFAF